MTDNLNFLVKQDLWLAVEKEPVFKILNWTTIEPKFDNGHIKKNTVLIFSHMYEDALNFIIIEPGPAYDTDTPEFLQDEIEALTKANVLELIQTDNIVEATVIPGFPELTQGQILIRESRDFIYNNKTILPQELDIVMGARENRQSQGEISVGEKISLRHILDVYSTSIGHNKIQK